MPTAVCILERREERVRRPGLRQAAATSGTRFRGRDGGQCTTPAPPREERRDGVEGREGRGMGERGKVGPGAIVARLRHRERRKLGW